jgi:hypothetical protein
MKRTLKDYKISLKTSNLFNNTTNKLPKFLNNNLID